ncbi:hypothetical protein [Aureimonas sp. AU40]|uniref:hypothetical protein n=1 Tax=Aureimonas sp. AU40 TaxID=1637747 RepID=UPI0012E34A90|nr:hypothetical protein [Aureimonas sp. AU40]
MSQRIRMMGIGMPISHNKPPLSMIGLPSLAGLHLIILSMKPAKALSGSRALREFAA